MSWQDDLRRLDEELSAGRIAADDYRLRREQLLAAAAGGAPAPQDPPQQSGDSTQVMRPVSQPGNPAEATQAVQGGWQQQQPNAGSQESDADRTQIVPGDRTQVVQPQQYPGQTPAYSQPSSPAGGFPQPPANQQWGAQGDASPPWGGGDFPPLSSTPNWIKQGPEVFDESSSNAGRRVLIIVGIVVVVALIAAAVWFFGFRGSSTNQTGGGTATTTTAPPTTTTTKKTIDRLPTPPGTANPNNGNLTVAGAQSAQLLSADEISALQAAGVKNIAFKGSTRDAFTYQGFVFQASSAASAAQLATTLSGLEKSGGLVPGAHGSLPASATVLQLVRPGTDAHYNVAYSTGPNVIMVDVVQTSAQASDSAVLQEFEPYAVSVAQAFPGS